MALRTLETGHPPGFRARLIWFLVFLVACFMVLGARLAHLQIVQGTYYRSLSENNRIRIQPVAAPRGKILDRHGRLLVGNRPAFNLMVVPEDAGDLDHILQVLSAQVAVDRQALERRLERTPAVRPVLISRDIPRNALAFVAERRPELPGIRVVVEPLRSYQYGSLAAHLFGYLGEITESQLAEARADGYQVGDLVGQYGLERQYEAMLRGKRGTRRVEVDALGRELLQLEGLPPKPGLDLVLSIDWDLQKLAEELMEPYSGVLIAMDPRTGEVLAMVSRPSFDPNLFSGGISQVAWESLKEDPQHPLQNRAIQGQYPPGSIFKIVVAAAALEEGVIKPEDSVICTGKYAFGDRVFRDWKLEGHGEVDLYKALVESCDVYFYQVGHALGIDRLTKYAKAFGLGAPTGIGLAHEKAGLVPSRQWKLKAKGEPWQPGETLTVSIGQGFNLVTPMQVAYMVSAIANGGTFYRPLLVKEVRGPSGQLVARARPEARGRIPISPENLEIVRRALLGVVNEPTGTGTKARLKDVLVAGKTGTAQVIQQRPAAGQDEEELQKKLPKHLRDHAWFVAFAPYEEPTVALVIFIENAGRGGGAFAHLARKLIRAHLDSRASRLAKDGG